MFTQAVCKQNSGLGKHCYSFKALAAARKTPLLFFYRQAWKSIRIHSMIMRF